MKTTIPKTRSAGTDLSGNAGFTVEEILEREPYAPEVEYQSRRAYAWAHKPEKTDEA